MAKDSRFTGMSSVNEANGEERDGGRRSTPSLRRQTGFSFRKKLWLKPSRSRGGTSKTEQWKGLDDTVRTVSGSSATESSATDLYPDLERRTSNESGIEIVLTSVRGRSHDVFARRVFASELSRHIEEHFDKDGLGYQKSCLLGAVRGVEVVVEVENAEVLREHEKNKKGQVLLDVRIVYTQVTHYFAKSEFDARHVLVEGPFHNRWSREAFGARLKTDVPRRMGAFERVGKIGLPVIHNSANDSPETNAEISDHCPTLAETTKGDDHKVMCFGSVAEEIKDSEQKRPTTTPSGRILTALHISSHDVGEETGGNMYGGQDNNRPVTNNFPIPPAVREYLLSTLSAEEARAVMSAGSTGITVAAAIEANKSQQKAVAVHSLIENPQ